MTVKIIDFGPFTRLIIEDREGTIHDIEITDETADELENLPCGQCPVAMYRYAL